MDLLLIKLLSHLSHVKQMNIQPIHELILLIEKLPQPYFLNYESQKVSYLISALV